PGRRARPGVSRPAVVRVLAGLVAIAGAHPAGGVRRRGPPHLPARAPPRHLAPVDGLAAPGPAPASSYGRCPGPTATEPARIALILWSSSRRSRNGRLS